MLPYGILYVLFGTSSTLPERYEPTEPRCYPGPSVPGRVVERRASGREFNPQLDKTTPSVVLKSNIDSLLGWTPRSRSLLYNIVQFIDYMTLVKDLVHSTVHKIIISIVSDFLVFQFYRPLCNIMILLIKVLGFEDTYLWHKGDSNPKEEKRGHPRFGKTLSSHAKVRSLTSLTETLVT